MQVKLLWLLDWWKRNVFFISWGKQWKGIYIHCFPGSFTYRYYWANGKFQTDWHSTSFSETLQGIGTVKRCRAEDFLRPTTVYLLVGKQETGLLGIYTTEEQSNSALERYTTLRKRKDGTTFHVFAQIELWTINQDYFQLDEREIAELPPPNDIVKY